MLRGLVVSDVLRYEDVVFVFALVGLSGRSLRKLPFLAHAALADPHRCDLTKFLHALVETARRETAEILPP